jgi:hypothetical protein
VKRAAVLASAGLWMCIGPFLPAQSRGVELNLATLSCDKYENEVLGSTLPGYDADPIDTVMWLFGFSVAKSGDHVMYGDSLTAFGFALDSQCKENPTLSVLEAVTTVKSKRQNPMDLTHLSCATFESRHVALRKSDPESADTLAMWLFGYSTGLSARRVLDPSLLAKFDATLLEHCDKHPEDSLFDALSAMNPAAPKR